MVRIRARFTVSFRAKVMIRVKDRFSTEIWFLPK